MNKTIKQFLTKVASKLVDRLNSISKVKRNLTEEEVSKYLCTLCVLAGSFDDQDTVNGEDYSKFKVLDAFRILVCPRSIRRFTSIGRRSKNIMVDSGISTDDVMSRDEFDLFTDELMSMFRIREFPISSIDELCTTRQYAIEGETLVGLGKSKTLTAVSWDSIKFPLIVDYSVLEGDFEKSFYNANDLDDFITEICDVVIRKLTAN